MKALALGLLAGWVLLAPHWQEGFGSAAACGAEETAWQTRAKACAQWVNEQYRAAPTGFWLEAVHHAAGQVEAARAAHCVERS